MLIINLIAFLLVTRPSTQGRKIPPNVRYDHEDKAQNIKHNNITFIMMSTYTYKFIRSFNLAKEKDMSIVEVATAYLSIFDEHEGRRSTTKYVVVVILCHLMAHTCLVLIPTYLEEITTLRIRH